MSLGLRAVIAATLMSFAAVTPAFADNLTVGAGSSNNIAPFGGKLTGGSSGTYQQVYAASDFASSPISITGLTFFYAGFGTSPANGTFTLSLSTTSKAVNGLDTTNFSDNIGANNTQVFSGLLAPQSNGQTLSFAFGGFNYNPSAGNLLLNITATGITSNGAPFKADTGTSGGVYSRATDFVVAGFDNYGLQTQFTYNAPAAAVPEPASWAMMILGMGAVGYALRRKVRASEVKFDAKIKRISEGATA